MKATMSEDINYLQFTSDRPLNYGEQVTVVAAIEDRDGASSALVLSRLGVEHIICNRASVAPQRYLVLASGQLQENTFSHYAIVAEHLASRTEKIEENIKKVLG